MSKGFDKEVREYYERTYHVTAEGAEYAYKMGCNPQFPCPHSVKAAFTAGRALGRREMKGEAKTELFHYHDDKNCRCDRAVNYVCDVCIALDACAAAIEAIPEEA